MQRRTCTLTGIALLATLTACSSLPDAGSTTSDAAATRLKEMARSGKAYATEDLMPLYDQLESVDTASMIGTWKGGKFDGCKPDPINWYGKRFNSIEDAEPLLARRPDGSVYSFDKWGMARLREISFRGKVSASLIYNNRPIVDYFRRLDADTVIGFGEPKGAAPFFFHLVREKR